MRANTRVRRARRKGMVGVGHVVTVNSAVVGEGRRIWRYGVVVSMLMQSKLPFYAVSNRYERCSWEKNAMASRSGCYF